VVIDHDGPQRSEDPDNRSKLTIPMKDVMSSLTPLLQMWSTKERAVKTGDFDERSVNYDNVPPDAPFDPLQAQLCPSSVNCFSLTAKKWFAISIDNLQPIVWDKQAWDHLVLDDEVKGTIRDVVTHHRADSDSVIHGDVITGKGNVSDFFIVEKNHR
jgi:hypothetical protein